MQADTFLSVNAPAQNALGAWLERKDAFTAEVLERVKQNFKTLRDAAGPALEAPEGGWYAVVPLPGGLTDEDAALRLLEEKNVLVHPGHFFELSREGLVVSLLPEPALFARAAAALKAYLL
jgi:aspartate/methionine/tyrosine aminotransferase